MKVVAHLIDKSTRDIEVMDVEKIEAGVQVVIVTMKNGEQIAAKEFDSVRDFDNFDKPMSGLSYLLQKMGARSGQLQL